MKTVDEILDYAIDQEQQAADFYTDLAGRAVEPNMKSALLGFAEEEKSHKRRLEEVKGGERELAPQQDVLDLKLSDYLVEVQATGEISYQDALIVAMKRERAAYQLYTDMAAKVSDGNLKTVLLGLAKEESKHKLFFESEYDEKVYEEN